MAITLTCGGIDTRAAPQMKSGNVTVEPALKFVITKSSTDRAKASSAAAQHPGRDQRQCHAHERLEAVRAEVLRRLLELRSKPIRRERTVTTTKQMLNMTCAIRMVVKPVA